MCSNVATSFKNMKFMMNHFSGYVEFNTGSGHKSDSLINFDETVIYIYIYVKVTHITIVKILDVR